MTTLAEVMVPVRHVLLDFDGPVCSVFGNLPAPEVARRLAAEIDEDMPAEDVGTDPLALLSVFAESGYDTLVAAEAKLRELEVEAVLSAPITPGVVEALQAFRDTGRTVTIVSNNSAAAVRRFLDDHQLDELVTDVCSRESPDPALLKPNSYLLNEAMRRRRAGISECVMIGDSVTDLMAAAAAGAECVAYASEARKIRKFQAQTPKPANIVQDLGVLAASVSKPSVARDDRPARR